MHQTYEHEITLYAKNLEINKLFLNLQQAITSDDQDDPLFNGQFVIDLSKICNQLNRCQTSIAIGTTTVFSFLLIILLVLINKLVII